MIDLPPMATCRALNCEIPEDVAHTHRTFEMKGREVPAIRFDNKARTEGVNYFRNPELPNVLMAASQKLKRTDSYSLTFGSDGFNFGNSPKGYGAANMIAVALESPMTQGSLRPSEERSADAQPVVITYSKAIEAKKLFDQLPLEPREARIKIGHVKGGDAFRHGSEKASVSF